MLVKKTNSVISLILIILLMLHVGTTLCYLLTGWFEFDLFTKLPRILGAVCMAHIAFSCIAVFFLNNGSQIIKYGKMNMRTIVQRVSGLVILLSLHFHIKSFEDFLFNHEPLTYQGKIVVFVIEMLFFAVVFAHVGVSFSRALISLGCIRSETVERRTDIAAGVFLVLLFAVTFFALARFLMNWPSA
jgi:succinate dehydrogenase hydrophobic anchor subunit